MKAVFRFYEELNDFLPVHRQKVAFEAGFKEKRSIKDMIESLGVPHTEIDLILVNGDSVGFDYLLEDGDRCSVYPVFERLNIENVTGLRTFPLRRTRFIGDVNIADIVKIMRMLGFDVHWDPSLSNEKIIDISRRENRIILTKSKKLLKFKDITHGIYIRPGTTVEQVRNIVDTLDIRSQAKPFSRCIRCNGLLESVPKEKVIDRIPPKVLESCHLFSRCASCHQVYWEGTHFTRMKMTVQTILADI